MRSSHKKKFPNVEQIKLKPLQGTLGCNQGVTGKKKYKGKNIPKYYYFIVLFAPVKHNFSICTALRVLI